jgi:hypothetical protein
MEELARFSKTEMYDEYAKIQRDFKFKSENDNVIRRTIDNLVYMQKL